MKYNMYLFKEDTTQCSILMKYNMYLFKEDTIQ